MSIRALLKASAESYTESNDAHYDHGEDIRPIAFDPLAKLGSLVKHAIAVGCSVGLVMTPIFRTHDDFSPFPFRLFASMGRD